MLSHNPIKALALFVKRHSIKFSLLSGPNFNSIRAFDEQNKDFPPKPYVPGIAKPTIFAINPEGVFTKRFADSDYHKCPTINDVPNALD